jgi:glucose-1-phosphate cytidylyltransferase
MKAVILAGGFGTRISEETDRIPKPMIEIGGKPILWHLMKSYSSHGINDFVICLGYRGYIIKEYFFNYMLHMSDITLDIRTGEMAILQNMAEDWKVTLVDTGEGTMTGGRLRNVRGCIENEEAVCFTYGDGLSDINISELIAFHKKHGRLATVTAVTPPGRYGSMNIKTEEGIVTGFAEKADNENVIINGGFFVLSPKVIEYIAGDETIWERDPMENLARDGQLMAYHHAGFWFAMDTLRDKRFFEDLWNSGKAPWKNW